MEKVPELVDATAAIQDAQAPPSSGVPDGATLDLETLSLSITGIRSDTNETVTPVSRGSFSPFLQQAELAPSVKPRTSATRMPGSSDSPSVAADSTVLRRTDRVMAFNRFILYENKLRFFLVASNPSDSRHKIIKIDRASQDELNIVEDEATYSGKQMSAMLKMLEDGNKGCGGLGKARMFFGVAGTLPRGRTLSSS